MGFSETGREILQADNTTKLPAYVWMPRGGLRGVLIGIHGGMAHGGDWVTPALWFMKRGIATYAPDLRWHGTYPQYNPGGKVFFHINSYDEYCRDIHALYQWVRAKHPGVPIFVISHSNGALIALLYGLTVGRDADIKGFIVSSPWLENRVKVPALLLNLSRVISILAPRFTIKPAPLIDSLTHDPQITARHRADEAAGLRGTMVTARLGVESMKAQKWVISHMKEWNRFPLFGIIAGKDALADPDVSEAVLRKVEPYLLRMLRYNENFHENFNEVNREEIYKNIENWMAGLMPDMQIDAPVRAH
ncbi:MAG: alpha/beta fold hydrolase [Spirochaetes bacterium]|nr:alpha/beta fold hydrolase [Spirochaetota bacterium]